MASSSSLTLATLDVVHLPARPTEAVIAASVGRVVVGMADQVSVVTRQTLIQLSTPDELRGRVSSVNMVFIGASNQLGDVESGFLAALTSATFTVLFGGAACLAVVGLIAWRIPELRGWHAPAPDDRN